MKIKINKERRNYRDENATDMREVDITVKAFMGLLSYAAIFKSSWEYKNIICFRQHWKGYLSLSNDENRFSILISMLRFQAESLIRQNSSNDIQGIFK